MRGLGSSDRKSNAGESERAELVTKFVPGVSRRTMSSRKGLRGVLWSGGACQKIVYQVFPCFVRYDSREQGGGAAAAPPTLSPPFPIP